VPEDAQGVIGLDDSPWGSLVPPVGDLLDDILAKKALSRLFV
jgi:hypothetical protein